MANITQNIAESIAVTEGLAKDTIYNLAESVSLVELFSRNTSKALQDSFQIQADYRIPTHATISSMAIRSVAMEGLEDLENLRDTGSPAGYNNFRTYIQGDYTYEKALIKVANEGKLATLSSVSIEVDILDVTDRSSAPISITAGESDGAGKVINYNKSFYIAPEVVITLRDSSSVVKIPRVISKDNTSFTVKVLDSAGNGIDAEISWIAQGY